MVNTVISSMMPNVSSAGIIRGIMITLIVLMILLAVGTWLFLHFKNRRYKEYKVVIFEKDSTGNVHEYYDRAGTFLNRQTNLKLLFLKRMKKGLNPNNVPYTSARDKKNRLIKTIYLLRTGVSNYRFIRVSIVDGALKFTVGEEDVNWAAQDYEQITKTFSKDSWLTKFGPWIAGLIVLVIIMILVLSLFNKFTILKETANSLNEVGKNMYEIAKVLNSTRMNYGTPIIVPGVGG